MINILIGKKTGVKVLPWAKSLLSVEKPLFNTLATGR